jgi:hypothetical protein
MKGTADRNSVGNDGVRVHENHATDPSTVCFNHTMIYPSQQAMKMMRQISCLGMEDPAWGYVEKEIHDSLASYPSHLFDEMGADQVPAGMCDMISVSSDPTAAGVPPAVCSSTFTISNQHYRGLDLEMYRTILDALHQQTPLAIPMDSFDEIIPPGRSMGAPRAVDFSGHTHPEAKEYFCAATLDINVGKLVCQSSPCPVSQSTLYDNNNHPDTQRANRSDFRNTCTSTHEQSNMNKNAEQNENLSLKFIPSIATIHESEANRLIYDTACHLKSEKEYRRLNEKLLHTAFLQTSQSKSNRGRSKSVPKSSVANVQWQQRSLPTLSRIFVE